MERSSALDHVAQILEVFAAFAQSGLNIAAARAVLFVGMASSNYESPLLPSVIDVARAIEMSPSGASRLLSGLVKEHDPFISSDKGIKDGRSESFFLTTRGQVLIERALRLFAKVPEDQKIEPLDIPAYARAKYIDKKGASGLALEGWYGSELIVADSGVDWDHPLLRMSDTCSDIARETDKSEKIKHKKKLKFENRSQTMLFMCRQGLPLRNERTIDRIGNVDLTVQLPKP